MHHTIDFLHSMHYIPNIDGYNVEKKDTYVKLTDKQDEK